MALPQPGDELEGKYRIERVLGEGGMGVVFAARHLLLGQSVAIKFLRPEVATHREAVTRFLNEARAAAGIKSHNVARVLDVAVRDQVPYMVMELLAGQDLADLLERDGPFPVGEAADHLLEAIAGIAHAHAAGIVHRDLKPANLFLTAGEDAARVVKVLDFGISKLTGPGEGGEKSVTDTNSILGSPAYMSPEQLRSSKDVDVRADVWSLGVIAYELLTGRLPFGGENVVEIFAATQETTPLPIRATRGDVPPELEAAILRCLAPKRSDRFADVVALGNALVPFATPRGAGALAEATRVLGPTVPARDSERQIVRTPVSTREGAIAVVATPTLLADTPPTVEARARRTTGGAWATQRGETSRAHARRLVLGLFVVAVAAGGALVAVRGRGSATPPERMAPEPRTQSSEPLLPVATLSALPPPPPVVDAAAPVAVTTPSASAPPVAKPPARTRPTMRPTKTQSSASDFDRQ